MSARRLAWSVAVAGAAVVACISPAAAFTWNPPVALTGTGHEAVGREGIARTGPLAAVVAYWDTTTGTTRVRIRRTADGGATWLPAQAISGAGAHGAQRVSIAAQGQTVIASFAQGSGCPGTPCGLHVARSVDGGANWNTPVALSAGDASAGEVAIRGSVAVVAWNDRVTGQIRVRVSSNAGVSFAPAQLLGVSANLIGATHESRAAVAIGSGVIYVSYMSDTQTLKLRRSTDGGVTWHPAQTISTQAAGLFGQDLAAAGNTAVVAFTRQVSPDTWVAYRRTTNKGAAWSGAANLTPPSAPTAADPIVDAQGGSWRVAYSQCLTSNCTSDALFIRSAPDARTWSGRVRVTPGPGTSYTAGGSVVAGRLIVAYTRVHPDTTEDVVVRTGN